MAAPHAVSGGREGVAEQGRRAASEGGGRGTKRAGGGWRGGAHPASCLNVHPLLHEAFKGGEVAILRCLVKLPLRLRAQPSALSASQEQGGERLGGVHDRSYIGAKGGVEGS